MCLVFKSKEYDMFIFCVKLLFLCINIKLIVKIRNIKLLNKDQLNYKSKK